MSNLFPCGNCPVENIVGIWRFQRSARYYGITRSIPGHLLHYIVSGSYKLKIGAKQYYPHKGDLLYYYGSEEVIWEGDDSEVDFYSVGFMGTGIPVLSPDERIIKAPDGMIKKWDKLWEVSKYPDVKKGTILSYSILLDLVLSVFWKEEGKKLQSDSNSWLKIEKLIRSGKLYHLSPDHLAEKAGLSRTSIYNLCRKEIGSTPVRRLKEIRIEEAKGLLKYTEMRIGEISDYLGYRRIHDFSREFKKESGVSAREYRQAVHKENHNPERYL